ncbi:OmpA family protein [Comamonas badia]|uniref:OmpA family protein n=1 Tax=Comamonas badia TaxID=265291 RepID=UPI000419005B|nr:OmpA family protein [Comamonas badia]
MSTQNDEHQGFVLALLVALVLFVLIFVFSIAFTRIDHKTAAPAVAAAPVAAVVAGDAAQVVVLDGMVKFYFASGKADVADGAGQALAVIVEGVKAGKKAVISGFHDTTGSQQVNEELSKQRAIAVRDALLALGVQEGSVELRKPENSAVQGNPAEARRVEVTLQ